ncbi:MAG: glycosyltransferase family 4 protein [Anaerolineales bacterium]|nr:glycosyltransferase family 4 protein [Anaerolineales bacterium]
MNVLMIGLGDSGLDRPDSEPVRRQLEYARRIGGHIDLIVESPSGGTSEFGALTVHRTGTNRIRFPLASYRLARTAAIKHPPDLITTQDPFATALAGLWLRRALHRPLLVQNHSCFLFNPHWIAERPVVFRAYHALARSLLPRADAWRVVNTVEREIYIRKLGLPADRVRVLPVPCDLDAFSKRRSGDAIAEGRKRWGIPPGAPVIAWAGRPVWFKRLPLLFQAFAGIREKNPDARLLIAGRKELAQEDLDRAARKFFLEDALTWTGELAHSELADAFAGADVFLHASIYEGFGRVLAEAGAAGLPVTATATAGARDIIVEGETGFLVPVENAAALARRACDLLSDPESRRKMGETARENILERFDPAKMVDGIVAQWRETAAAGVSP